MISDSANLLMNLFIPTGFRTVQQARNLPESVKMSELDSLLTRFGQSRDSLKKACDMDLFRDLMQKIPSFDLAAPYFDLTKPELEEFHNDYKKEKCRRLQMLWRWEEKKGSDATYLALVKVFLKMDNKLLAEFVVQHAICFFEQELLDSHLTPKLKNDLLLENQKIRRNFHSLFLCILDSFEKRNITVKQLMIFLQSYVRNESPTTLFLHFQSDIGLKDLFLILLNHYLSWFNTELLKAIVEEFGCDNDKTLLTAYEQNELIPYLQRSIFQIPESFTTQHETASMVHLHFYLPHDQIPTGQDVYYFQRNVSRYFGISRGIIQFVGFKHGSIILIFQLPETLLEQNHSIKNHFTYDPVKKTYNYNEDLDQIL